MNKSGFWVLVFVASSLTAQTHTGASVKKMPTIRFTCGAEGYGRVDMMVDIDEKGKPFNIRLKSTTANSNLTQASLRAAKHWRFTPAETGGQPVREFDFDVYHDFNCDRNDVEQYRASQRQAELRQRAGLYMMTCKDADMITCAAKAELYARGLPVPAENQSGETLQTIPLLQAQSGRPAYVGPLGPQYPNSIQAIIPAGNGVVIKLMNNTTWALTLINYMPQNFQMWMPTDMVTITADDQTYILYNQRLNTVLRAIYLGQ